MATINSVCTAQFTNVCSRDASPRILFALHFIRLEIMILFRSSNAGGHVLNTVQQVSCVYTK